MARVCGHCHHIFPGKYSLWLDWCKLDRTYVCRRCKDEVCNQGEEKHFTSGEMGLIGRSLFVILFVGMLLPWIILDNLEYPVLWVLELLAFGIPTVTLLAPALHRHYLHSRNLKGVAPKTIPKTVEDPDPALSWVNTGALDASGHWNYLLGGTAAGIITVFLLPILPETLEYILVVFGGSALVTSMGFCFLVFLLPGLPGGADRPDKLALSRDGIMCYYHDPMVAYIKEKQKFIPWWTVRSIKLSNPDSWFLDLDIDLVTGGSFSFARPRKELLTLVENWKSWKEQAPQQTPLPTDPFHITGGRLLRKPKNAPNSRKRPNIPPDTGKQ